MSCARRDGEAWGRVIVAALHATMEQQGYITLAGGMRLLADYRTVVSADIDDWKSLCATDPTCDMCGEMWDRCDCRSVEVGPDGVTYLRQAGGRWTTWDEVLRDERIRADEYERWDCEQRGVDPFYD